MNHVLVTGGCGFIGCHFVRHLLEVENDVRVTNLDALTYAGNPDNLREVDQDPRYRFVHGDISNRDDVAKAVQPFDGAAVTRIVNFAAESHVDRSIEDASPFIQANVVGVMTLLDAARRLASEGQFERFVQVSTDEVYGSLGDTGLFSEESPLAPSSPYSAAKTSGDLFALSYQHTFDLPVVVTRCSNNYGPNQYPEKLIPRFIQLAQAGEKLPVYGTGENVRDWIHVKDHCRGVYAALQKGVDGQVYNFGASCERTNMQITRAILGQLDRPETLIEFVEDRLGHDWRYAIDSSKAQADLGWAPEFNFEEGLADTVKWYLENEEWTARLEARLASFE